MTAKKKGILCFIALCAVLAAGFCLFRNRSVLPLPVDKIVHIDIMVYPQDIPVYTVTDPGRVREITETMNALEREDSQELPNPIGEKGNYYYLELKLSGKSLSVALDSGHIWIGQERYRADCGALCDLLEQTYQNRKNGIIG